MKAPKGTKMLSTSQQLYSLLCELQVLKCYLTDIIGELLPFI